jgi:hypothetical protein
MSYPKHGDPPTYKTSVEQSTNQQSMGPATYNRQPMSMQW